MLVAISASSVIFVEQAREDSRWVVHTTEVENQISTLLLEIRRAESAVRGYLLTSDPQFLAEHQSAVAGILPDVDKLVGLTGDNPVQVEAGRQLRSAVATRLAEFRQAVDFVRQKDTAGGIAMLRGGNAETVQTIDDVTATMRTEEERLFAERTASADRSQRIASIVTIAGSGLVIALAGISIVLVRRSARARDAAEAQLRDNNLNLEATVDERTADLREANNEIQRFAYIVSHDLRSPLVNIMGFTSELEELRGDIFRRIAALGHAASDSSAPVVTGDTEPVLDGEDQQLSQDFTEALGFIKSSIAKMDRLISAILNLTREGRREFEPVPDRHPRTDRSHRHDCRAPGFGSRGQNSDRAAAGHRQRPSRAGTDFLQSDRQCAEISQAGSSRRHLRPGPDQAGFCDFRGRRQRPRHRSQGSSTDF